MLNYQWIKTTLVLIHRWIKTSIRKLRLLYKVEEKQIKVKWESLSNAGFLVKFGLVLICILKVYRKKILFYFIEIKYLQFITCIFLLKSMCLLKFFKNLSVENLETTPSNFLSKLCSEIFLSPIINCWGSIFTLYLTWGAYSLVCVVSVFFFFLFLLFFLYWYFPWETLTIHRTVGMGEWIIVFLVFHFHPLTNIYLVYRDFYHFFLINLFVITRLITRLVVD